MGTATRSPSTVRVTERTQRAERAQRTQRSDGNELAQWRGQAVLQQWDIAVRLTCTRSRTCTNGYVAKIEKWPLAKFAGKRRLIINWAIACGMGPDDERVQRFLALTGNAHWRVDEQDADVTAAFVRFAVELARDPTLARPFIALAGELAALARERNMMPEARLRRSHPDHDWAGIKVTALLGWRYFGRHGRWLDVQRRFAGVSRSPGCPGGTSKHVAERAARSLLLVATPQDRVSGASSASQKGGPGGHPRCAHPPAALSGPREKASSTMICVRGS